MHTCCGSTHEWHLAGCSGPRQEEWIRHVGPMFDSVHFLGADNYHCEIFTPKHCPVYLSIRPIALTREQAKTMAKYLLAWAETGTLDVSEKSKDTLIDLATELAHKVRQLQIGNIKQHLIGPETARKRLLKCESEFHATLDAINKHNDTKST